MYDPEANQPKVDFAIQQLLSKISGNYIEPGKELKITQLEEETSIKEFLSKNLNTDLSVDIETTGLKHFDSEIVSISFGLSSTEATAFLITPEIKPILKNYFLNRTGKNIYHNASFDVYILIYHLFMEHSLDYPGLLSGLDVMLYNYEDTMLIAYLATNTCAGATLGLKDLVATSFGDYAEDVTDVTSLTVDTLLTYNGKDTCATWEVWDTYHPKVLEDQQKELYETVFKDAQKDIIQMQLSGMPVDMDRVLEVDQELNQLANGLLESINSSSIVKEVTQLLREEWAVKKNKTLKVKRVTSNDSKLEFNPNSDDHIRKICYTLNDLPVIETTATGLASVGGEILHQLSQQTTGELQELLKNLADLSKIDKIITSFIPALKASHRAKDGWHYLYGNFKLGGTVSGRLSSNSPNLQNLPANSIYGKLIKSCFKAPEGWLFVGIDFNSLEDRISALTTKDDNKLKVYTENYDGHCLRAYSYFSDQMPDIDPTSVESINSIATKYKDLRQKSKAPTFALTYGGTFRTLMTNCGFAEDLAKSIESGYHELYKQSDAWVKTKIDQACIDGYVTTAFGLRLRTPLLKQSILGNKKSLREAAAESRTAANALGQGWCLLNNRAASEFLGKVRSSKYKYSIKPCAQIHDAQYYLVKESPSSLAYVNKHLINAVNWNAHPDIYHPVVGLGGELSIFYPTWKEEIVIENNESKESICKKLQELKN